MPSPGPAGARITGVVDWAAASWGPRFVEAYEEAGGVLAATANERLYWQVRAALAFSEDVRSAVRTWREAGRAERTTRAVEERLDAYVTALMDALG
ncbi:hypothetical protein OK074_1545 [Actinobacteria bacterium OK074]|nr:hypothetical protein OK074_1545 [Actinobacteria bacterium OK074]